MQTAFDAPHCVITVAMYAKDSCYMKEWVHCREMYTDTYSSQYRRASQSISNTNRNGISYDIKERTQKKKKKKEKCHAMFTDREPWTKGGDVRPKKGELHQGK